MNETRCRICPCANKSEREWVLAPRASSNVSRHGVVVCLCGANKITSLDDYGSIIALEGSPYEFKRPRTCKTTLESCRALWTIGKYCALFYLGNQLSKVQYSPARETAAPLRVGERYVLELRETCPGLLAVVRNRLLECVSCPNFAESRRRGQLTCS